MLHECEPTILNLGIRLQMATCPRDQTNHTLMGSHVTHRWEVFNSAIYW